jgi:hypothetical protein
MSNYINNNVLKQEVNSEKFHVSFFKDIKNPEAKSIDVSWLELVNFLESPRVTEVKDTLLLGPYKLNENQKRSNSNVVEVSLLVFDIDVQGAINLKEKLGDKALAVFIAPPNLEVLKNRLASRGTESKESFEKRIHSDES